jgi:hypothetical protein
LLAKIEQENLDAHQQLEVELAQLRQAKRSAKAAQQVSSSFNCEPLRKMIWSYALWWKIFHFLKNRHDKFKNIAWWKQHASICIRNCDRFSKLIQTITSDQHKIWTFLSLSNTKEYGSNARKTFPAVMYVC